MKLGGAATWLAASVALTPYAVCAVLCSVFVIGYAVALLRFVWSGSDGLDAMEHVLAMTANAIVGILTLTQVDSGRLPERGPDRTAPAG